MVIESLLPDCTFHNVLRVHLIHHLMANLVPSTEKLDFYIKFVLEHIVRGIKVVLEFLNVS